jgi:hypothetical protein
MPAVVRQRPIRSDSTPPSTQPSAPAATTTKANIDGDPKGKATSPPCAAMPKARIQAHMA